MNTELKVQLIPGTASRVVLYICNGSLCFKQSSCWISEHCLKPASLSISSLSGLQSLYPTDMAVRERSRNEFAGSHVHTTSFQEYESLRLVAVAFHIHLLFRCFFSHRCHCQLPHLIITVSHHKLYIDMTVKKQI